MRDITTRQEFLLSTGWRFHPALRAGGAMDASMDAWEPVRIPHDGRSRAQSHGACGPSGATRCGEDGGLPVRTGGPTGACLTADAGQPEADVRCLLTSAYSREFYVPAAWERRRVYVVCDGVRSSARLYVNDRLALSRDHAWIPFACDITSHLRFGTGNRLTVQALHGRSLAFGRAAPAIDRQVRLVVVDPVHITPDGIAVDTSEVGEEAASLRVRVPVRNVTDRAERVGLTAEVYDPDGRHVMTLSDEAWVGAGKAHLFVLEGLLERPRTWSVDEPYLYTALCRVGLGGRVVDDCAARFGVRSVAFDPDKGILLNGREVVLRAVQFGRDFGGLGRPFSPHILTRELRTLRKMGCNTLYVRWAWSSPDLLHQCDRTGIFVVYEFDYARNEAAFAGDGGERALRAERAVRDAVRYYSRHPSLIMWSFTGEWAVSSGMGRLETALFLTAVCHREDPTRPVTSGIVVDLNGPGRDAMPPSGRTGFDWPDPVPHAWLVDRCGFPTGLYGSYQAEWLGSAGTSPPDEDGRLKAPSFPVGPVEAPERIVLRPEPPVHGDDGTVMHFIALYVTDGEGRTCPLAGHLVTIDVYGGVERVAFVNGMPDGNAPWDTWHCSVDERARGAVATGRVHGGRALLAVLAVQAGARVVVRASSAGLEEAFLVTGGQRPV